MSLSRHRDRCIRWTALLLCISGTGLLVNGPTTFASDLPSSYKVAQTPIERITFYVNPAIGQDAAGFGSETRPFRTISFALQQLAAIQEEQRGNPIPTIIRLVPGTYSQQTGETFPLVLAEETSLLGDESTRGQTVVIEGGGYRVSPTFAGQNMTIWAGKNSQIRGVTVINKNVRGTGIWIESGSPAIANSIFTQSHREGIFITGTGNPKVEGNIFTANGGNGISVANNARGEIQDNLFQNTGFGLAVSENATPRIARNRIIQNVDGIYMNDAARPTLRDNVIENNKRDGIVATTRARPDLGTLESVGNNIIRNNGKHDVNNGTPDVLYSVGNTLDTKKIAGQVELSGPPADNSLAAQTTFVDVQGHWAQPYIEALAKRNIINGLPGGVFKPDAPVTRVQFASIINKAFAPSAKRSAIAFKDIDSTFWGYQPIQAAVQSGFMNGDPDGLFKPDQPVLRVQVLVALANGLGFNNGDPSLLSMFQDATAIPDYAAGPVAAATRNKIVVNYPTLTQLNPNREVTRAEVAAFVYQALVNAGKAEAISSPYIVLVP
ncbi:MAG: DUF1565 domain-containing protein [Leptolyngbyaceae cyanobacterium RU_5_1]|nr:DUF1565 domain-containing protein [Leptolyngbyaceae cyanobacterium RU_5_1]